MSLVESFVEVTLREPEDFLKVKETLTRIGVSSRRDKTLYQSCHILHKRGKYYLVHFKELFLLDGKQSDFTEDDRARRNAIALLLDEWGLLSVVSRAACEEQRASMSAIKVISYREKDEWCLESKYTVGKKKR